MPGDIGASLSAEASGAPWQPLMMAVTLMVAGLALPSHVEASAWAYPASIRIQRLPTDASGAWRFLVGHLSPLSPDTEVPRRYATDQVMTHPDRAYARPGVEHVAESDQHLFQAIQVHRASRAGVEAYLHAHPHLSPRLEWLGSEVAQLWNPSVAGTLTVKLVDDPEEPEPSLVVTAEAPATTAEQNADHVSTLFARLYDHFGPWPQGVGFGVVVTGSLEDV